MSTPISNGDDTISKAEKAKRLRKWGWCRGVTHFWKQNGAIERRKGEYVVTLICANCGTNRVTRLDSSGGLIAHHTYENRPEDYSTPGHRASRSEVRMLMFVRATTKEK